MDALLLWIGRAAGVAGVAVTLAASAARLMNAYWIAGFQTGTIFLAGIAGMTLGCFCMLAVLTRRPR